MQGNSNMGNEIVIVPVPPVDLDKLPLITDLQYLEPFGSESLNRKFYGIIPPGVYRGFRSSLPGGMTLRIGRNNEAGTAIVELNSEHCLTVQQRKPIDLAIPAGFLGFVVLEAFYQFGIATSQVDQGSSIEAARLQLVSKSELQPSHVVLYSLSVPANASALTSDMVSASGRNDVSISTDSNIYNLLDDHLEASLLARVEGSAIAIDNMRRHLALHLEVQELKKQL